MAIRIIVNHFGDGTKGQNMVNKEGNMIEIGHVRVSKDKPLEKLDFELGKLESFEVIEPYHLTENSTGVIIHVQINRTELKQPLKELMGAEKVIEGINYFFDVWALRPNYAMEQAKEYLAAYIEEVNKCAQ